MKTYNLFSPLQHLALAASLLAGVYALPFSAAAQSRFTLVALPDTQYYTDSANGGTPGMFTAQTTWVVNNRSWSNIVYVTHMGDLVDHNDQYQSEWQNVNNAMYLLDTANIPYGTAVGNHDQNGGVNGPNGTSHTVYYNTYYGVSHFTGKSWYGGHDGNNNNDHYDLLTINGVGYLILYLEYDGSNLYPDVLTTWAVGVLNSYPTRRAIVVEHDMMMNNDFTPQGQRIYDVVKNCPNVFLMLCGHNNTGRRLDIWNGSMISTVQEDYQAWPNGGNGYLRILNFAADGTAVHFQTYSPYADVWLTGGGDDFTLNLFESRTSYSPACANWSGPLEMAGVETDGSVYHIWQNGSGNWGSWNLLSGVTAQQNGAIMARDLDGRLEAFAIGASDGAVYHNWQTTPSGGWSGWASMGGSGGNLSACSAIKNVDGRLELFVVGGNSNIWHNAQATPGGSWNGWQPLGGSAMPGQAPAVGVHSNGCLEVFYNQANNSATYHLWQTNVGGGWSSPAAFGGGNNLSGITAVQNRNNNLELFVVGSDSGVWHKWEQAGGWSNWSQLQGGFKVKPQTPAVGVNLDKSLAVICNNSTNAIPYLNVCNTSGTWSNFQSTGGGGGNLSGLKTSLDANGCLEMFVVGGNGAVWYKKQTSSGGSTWTGWTSIGGAFNSL